MLQILKLRRNGQQLGPLKNVSVWQLGLEMMTFFCHWLAENDQHVYDALTSMGHDEFVFTAWYEASTHLDVNFLSDETATAELEKKVSVDA